MSEYIVWHPPEIRITDFVARGSYGLVFRGVRVQDGAEQEIAVKVIPDYSCKHLVATDAFRRNRTRQVCRELLILQKFAPCKEVIDLVDAYVSPNGEQLCLVMPFVPHTLRSMLTQLQRRMTEEEVSCLACQVLVALEKMEACNCIHRDLSPSNILFDPESFRCFVADFGLARANFAEGSPMTPDLVTLPYRPPEILMQCRNIDNRADIWSMGIIVLQLLTFAGVGGKDEARQLSFIISHICGPPDLDAWKERASTTILAWLERNWKTILAANFTPLGARFPFLSSPCIDVLQAMLRFDPRHRCSATEALSMEWFRINKCEQQIEYLRDPQRAPLAEPLPDLESMDHPQLTEQVRQSVWCKVGEIESRLIPQSHQ